MTAAPRLRSEDSAVQRIHLALVNRPRTRAVDRRWLRRIARALLAELPQIKRADLGVFLVNTSEITRLNETFLHHVGATDVIAFDYSEPLRRRGGFTSAAADRARSALHGEIFICVDEAARQARRFRTTWQSELVRYLVHGVLHLCGYDDQCAADRRAMKREENRLLRSMLKRFPLA